MATPGLGHKTTLAIGKESSYGAGAAPTRKFEVVSWNVAPTVGVIQDSSLYAQQSRRALYQGGFLVRGTFVVRLNYEGLLELFRGVCGGYSSPAVVGDPTVIDHTFKEAAALPSYQMEVSAGDVPTGKVFKLTGAKLLNVTVRGTAGNGNDAMLMAEFTVLAKDMQSNQDPSGSPVGYSPFPVLFHQAITMDDGTADASSSVRVRGVEVSLENPHAEDRFYFGAQNIDEPVRSDFLVARFRFTQEFITKTQYDAARAFTVGSPQLVCQHPATIGLASKREFEARANSANLVDFSSPVEGYGVLIATATWEAYFNSGDATALAFRFRNGETALP